MRPGRAPEGEREREREREREKDGDSFIRNFPCVGVCMFVWWGGCVVCVCVCVCVCMYVHACMHTHTRTTRSKMMCSKAVQQLGETE